LRRGGRLRTVILSVVALSAAAGQDGEKLVKANDCSSCHAPDRQSVGPAYSAIAKRYAGQSDAVDKLAARIRDGGSGVWGSVAMTPHPDLTAAQREEMTKWILSLTSVAAQNQPETALYTYTLKDGSTVKLDFPLFVEGKSQKVTKAVFRGYELFNSYCYRCHGLDATGGQLAPDLRHSLAVGMQQQEFLSVTMAGRKEKGMPTWAGFLSQEEGAAVYRYVKGRSLELIPSGRPPSEQD